jgi:hypothetical protein
MSPRRFALLASSLIAVACGSSPNNLTCPTKAQSLTFTAAGSCGGGEATGMVTVSTQPGLCSLLVTGGPAVGLPSQGQFSGSAGKTATGYDLTQGNWYLITNEGNGQDGSTDITCDVSIDSGTFNLDCDGQMCPPDDCGGGSECSPISCTEHLKSM